MLLTQNPPRPPPTPIQRWGIFLYNKHPCRIFILISHIILRISYASVKLSFHKSVIKPDSFFYILLTLYYRYITCWCPAGACPCGIPAGVNRPPACGIPVGFKYPGLYSDPPYVPKLNKKINFIIIFFLLKWLIPPQIAYFALIIMKLKNWRKIKFVHFHIFETKCKNHINQNKLQWKADRNAVVYKIWC